MRKPTRLQRIIEGLEIFMEYDPDTTLTPGDDQIWAGAGVQPNEADRRRLGELGWWEDDEHGCWAHLTD